MCKKVDDVIIAFNATSTGSPFSILKVESFKKRTLLCRCTMSKKLFQLHHNQKGFCPQTNDLLLVQRKGIGTNDEIAKMMDYHFETGKWRQGKDYESQLKESFYFTHEIVDETVEV